MSSALEIEFFYFFKMTQIYSHFCQKMDLMRNDESYEFILISEYFLVIVSIIARSLKVIFSVCKMNNSRLSYCRSELKKIELVNHAAILISL